MEKRLLKLRDIGKIMYMDTVLLRFKNAKETIYRKGFYCEPFITNYYYKRTDISVNIIENSKITTLYPYRGFTFERKMHLRIYNTKLVLTEKTYKQTDLEMYNRINKRVNS